MTYKSQAQTGFTKAEAYDAHRPSFPDESVRTLLENLRLLGNKGATVIDLAAGTGKFTEILAKRKEGFKIIAVEPHDDMRAVLEKKNLPGVRVLKGLSTEIPVDDLSVDAVIAAQAWHWFANQESLKEIHRVIQPHGAFGMIWNVEDYNAPKEHKAASSWEQTMQDFVWSLDDNQPRYRHMKWRDIFDEQLKTTPLSVFTSAEPLMALPIGGHEERWEVWLPKDRIWDRLHTLSQITTLEPKEKEDAKKLFDNAINSSETEVNDKGEVAVHGGTFAHWTTKIPAEG